MTDPSQQTDAPTHESSEGADTVDLFDVLPELRWQPRRQGPVCVAQIDRATGRATPTSGLDPYALFFNRAHETGDALTAWAEASAVLQPAGLCMLPRASSPAPPEIWFVSWADVDDVLEELNDARNSVIEPSDGDYGDAGHFADCTQESLPELRIEEQWVDPPTDPGDFDAPLDPWYEDRGDRGGVLPRAQQDASGPPESS